MQIGLLSLLVLATTVATAPAQTSESRPNILFIAVDDLRTELGCYGSPHIQSPQIDAFAKTAVVFRRAYCAQAVCNPSRASLLTGKRPDTIRVWDLVTPLRTTVPDVVTLPQHFKDQGYYSLAVGKIYHNTFPDRKSWSIPQPSPKPTKAYSEASLKRLEDYRRQMLAEGKTEPQAQRMRGPATEDEDVPDNARLDGAMTDLALEILGGLKERQDPWFFGVGFIRPHLAFTAPKKYWDLYDPKAIPLARNPQLPTGSAPMSMFGMYELRGYMDFASTAEAPALLTEEQQRRLKHGYYASVSYVDALIGRILGRLESLGLAENTVVVLWSDHGWKLGEHASWCKQTNYELDTNAPLIVRRPGARGNGQSTSALVEFVDVYPTLCDVAGLPIPADLDGRSFAPVLEDPSRSHKPAAVSQFLRRYQGGEYMGYALRTDRYRLIEWIDRATGAVVGRELYDHATDPEENTSIAGDAGKQALVEDLSAQLWKLIPRPAVAEGRPRAQ